MNKPIPTINEITQPYWDAAREERLLVQVCNHCESMIHYPRRWCPKCWSTDLAHTEMSGCGEVLTFSVVYQGPAEAFSADTPYVVAIIKLKEGLSLLSNIVGSDALDVAIGDRVQVIYESRGDEIVMPQFQRISVDVE